MSVSLAPAGESTIPIPYPDIARLATQQGTARRHLGAGWPWTAAPMVREFLASEYGHQLDGWYASGLADAAWLAALLGDDIRAARLLGGAGIATTGGQALAASAGLQDVVDRVRATLGEFSFTIELQAGQLQSRPVLVVETLGWLNRQLIGHSSRPSRAGLMVPHLTPRERDVLQHLAAGATDREIAAALFISPHTATTHVRNLMEKLGARTRSAAVAHGVRIGAIAL